MNTDFLKALWLDRIVGAERHGSGLYLTCPPSSEIPVFARKLIDDLLERHALVKKPDAAAPLYQRKPEMFRRALLAEVRRDNGWRRRMRHEGIDMPELSRDQMLDYLARRFPVVSRADMENFLFARR